MNTTRRDFLTVAVTAAGATATHDLADAEAHDHQGVPSDVALRVKSLEPCWSKRGWSIQRRSTLWSMPMSTRSARAAAHG